MYTVTVSFMVYTAISLFFFLLLFIPRHHSFQYFVHQLSHPLFFCSASHQYFNHFISSFPIFSPPFSSPRSFPSNNQRETTHSRRRSGTLQNQTVNKQNGFSFTNYFITGDYGSRCHHARTAMSRSVHADGRHADITTDIFLGYAGVREREGESGRGEGRERKGGREMEGEGERGRGREVKGESGRKEGRRRERGEGKEEGK